jgi:hypothetical protein
MNTIKKYSTLLGAFCLSLFLPAVGSAAAQVGKPAPDFTLTDISGKAYRLSDLKGQTVVLEWVNAECPFVVRHYKSGNMPKLQRAATADGVVWLTINSARKGEQGDFEPNRVKEWKEKNGAAYTAYFRDQDGKVGKMYNARTTPHMFVINPQGVLVYDGAIDSSPRGSGDVENYVTAALAAVKTGSMPARSKTDPYGCNVKY